MCPKRTTIVSWHTDDAEKSTSDVIPDGIYRRNYQENKMQNFRHNLLTGRFCHESRRAWSDPDQADAVKSLKERLSENDPLTGYRCW